MQDTPLAVSFDALLSKGQDSLKTSLFKAIQREDFSAALKEANEDYAHKTAKDLDAALTYAILLTHRELGDEAAGVLRKAMEFHSQSPAIQLAQLDVLIVRGDFDAAKELADGLSAVSFNEPRHVAYLGDAYLTMNHLPEALNAFITALDMGLDDPSVAANAAQLYSERDEIENAAEMFERAGRIAATDPEYYLRAADAWLEAGVFDRAIRAYRRVVHMVPDNAHAWTFLGFAYREAGELESALEAFEKALKFDDEDLENVLNVAHVLLELGQPEQARQFYERASQLDPDDVEAVNGMVAAAYELGDVELAEGLGKKAVEMDPENPDNHYNLGVILLSINHVKDAETHFRTALDIDPDDPRYAVAVAQILLRQGANDEAIQLANVATTAVSEDTSGLFEFARDLLRYAGAAPVIEFVAKIQTTDTRWHIVKPIFEFLAHALRRQENETKDALDAFKTAINQHEEALPIMWDFEELERLAAGLETDQRKTLEIMIAVAEGRRELKHLERNQK